MQQVVSGTRPSHAYPILIATSVVTYILFGRHRLRISFDDVEVVATSVIFLAILGNLLRVRGFVRVGNMIELTPLFLVVSLSFALIGMGIAAGDAPLADRGLAAADAMIFPFLDWPEAIHSVARQGSETLVFLDFAYSSMGLQALGVVALSCLSNRRAHCERFIVTWVFALSVTMIISAAYPAAGAFKHFSISHADVAAIHSNVGWSAIPVIEGLRAGTITAVDWTNLEGLVSFPSFHAAAAVILARFYWDFATLRWPFVGLNVLMAIAAVPCGGHYFVDVLGGLCTAALALFVTHCTTMSRFRRLLGAIAQALRPRSILARAAERVS